MIAFFAEPRPDFSGLCKFLIINIFDLIAQLVIIICKDNVIPVILGMFPGLDCRCRELCYNLKKKNYVRFEEYK